MTTPTFTVWERRITAASLVFHLVDRLSRDRGTSGPNPPLRGPVRFRIVATEAGGVRTSLDSPRDMVIERNASGYHLWFGQVTVEGREFRSPSPPPALVIEIDAARYQREEVVIPSLPVADTPLQIALKPGYAYEFPRATALPGATGPTLLRGTLRRSGGDGIAGAKLRVNPPPPGQPAVVQPNPNPEYVTDATGNWVLPFVDAVASTNTAQVEITPAGQAPILVPEVTLTRGDTAVLRQASLSGTARLISGGPRPRVTVTIDLVPGASATSDSNGRWELWLPIELLLPSGGAQAAVITATPPQGASMVRNVQVQPRATTNVDSFVFP